MGRGRAESGTGRRGEEATGLCQTLLTRPPLEASSSPLLQVKRFGDGLVEALSAHQPVCVLRALALGRHVGEEGLGDPG